MPAMLRFDTLKFVKQLTDAGMDQRQAEALVVGLNEADVSQLAAKSDIAEVRAEIAGVKAEIAEVRTELKAEIAELRTELRTEVAGLKGEIVGVRSELKADIAALKGEMFRFLYVQAMGVIGLTVGLTVTLIKLLPG
jgi:predicted  nucleic acid-binding Zn-ribbon protein